MTESPYGLEARVQGVEMLQQTAARRARREPRLTPDRSSRHRLAERLRRVADRLDA
jgi:hypothetical protein